MNIQLVREILRIQKIREIRSSQFIAGCERYSEYFRLSSTGESVRMDLSVHPWWGDNSPIRNPNIGLVAPPGHPPAQTAAVTGLRKHRIKNLQNKKCWSSKRTLLLLFFHAIIICTVKKTHIIVIKTCNTFIPRPLWRTSKLKAKPQPSNKNIRQFKQNISSLFVFFLGSFWPTWIWIRIQPTKINVDPCGSASRSTTLNFLEENF